MPVKNSASGAWGGFVQGREGAQAFNAKEVLIEAGKINNSKSQAEFLHYLDTRKEAKNILKGQSSAANIIQQTEASEIREQNAGNEANALASQRQVDNAEGLDDLYGTTLETGAATQEATGNKARRDIANDDEMLAAERNSLVRQAQVDFLGRNRDEVNYMAEVLAPLGEQGQPGYGEIDDQVYGAMVNQLTEVFGKNADGVFKKYGITATMSKQGINAMKAIRQTAVHNVTTQQQEHLAMLKGQIDSRIALAKATGAYDAKSVIGKLMQDQQVWQEKALQAPQASWQQKQAIAAVGLFQDNINALTREGTAEASQRATEARDVTLKSNFPVMAAALASGEGGSEEAWAKLVSMQDFLRKNMTQQQTMEVLSRWYRYDSNTVMDDELVLNDTNDVLRSTLRVNKIAAEMLHTAEVGQGYAAMKDDELNAILADLDRQTKLEIEAKLNANKMITSIRGR